MIQDIVDETYEFKYAFNNHFTDKLFEFLSSV